MPTLPVRTQYLLAEILLIRLTSALEDFLAGSSYRIAVGAFYLDGTSPNLTSRCSSFQDARTKMLTLGREKPKQYLQWSRASYVKDNVKMVIDGGDHFLVTVDQFGAFWSECFKVRTFAAHRSTSSREKFKAVVSQIYGQPRRMELGRFLLSEQYVTQSNLTGI